MLNPSTADASQDDPTIRRCIGFARDNGYGAIVVVNIFAYRATNPEALPSIADEAIGPANVHHLMTVCQGKDVVVAWGSHRRASSDITLPALKLLRAYASRILCLGNTKSGAPRHPLYVAAGQSLISYGVSA